MRCLVILPLLLVTVYGMSPELEAVVKSELKRKGEECKAELGVSDDDIAPLMKHSLPTTHGGKCFLACLNKKCGIQDASGKVQAPDEFLEKIKAIDAEYYEKAKQIASVCMVDDYNHADECETASSLYSCVLEEKTKMGIPMITLD